MFDCTDNQYGSQLQDNATSKQLLPERVDHSHAYYTVGLGTSYEIIHHNCPHSL